MITNDQHNFVPYNQVYTASKTYKAKIIYAGRTGPDSADQGWTVPTRAGPGGAEQGRAGRSRTGSGRDGHWAGMGSDEQGWEGQGRTVPDRAGTGSVRQGRTGPSRARQDRQGQKEPGKA